MNTVFYNGQTYECLRDDSTEYHYDFHNIKGATLANHLPMIYTPYIPLMFAKLRHRIRNIKINSRIDHKIWNTLQKNGMTKKFYYMEFPWEAAVRAGIKETTIQYIEEQCLKQHQ